MNDTTKKNIKVYSHKILYTVFILFIFSIGVSQVIAKDVDYIIATDPTNAPFEMRNKAGKLVGLDIDLIDAIAKSQGFTFRFVPRRWQEIFDTLDNGHSDMITGIVVNTADRRTKYNFTDPILYKKRYAYLKQSIAKAYNIREFSDICQLKTAVKLKTDKEQLYKEVCKSTVNMIPVNSNFEAFRELVSGRVQATIGDNVIFNHYIKEYDIHDLVRLNDPIDTQLIIAWPVRRTDGRLLEQLNNGLRKLKQDGTFDQLKQKWLDE